MGGLRDLTFESWLEHAFPLAARRDCTAASLNLFADVFQPRCAAVLGHLNTSQGSAKLVAGTRQPLACLRNGFQKRLSVLRTLVR